MGSAPSWRERGGVRLAPGAIRSPRMHLAPTACSPRQEDEHDGIVAGGAHLVRRRRPSALCRGPRARPAAASFDE
ncbi:hypothetical protein GUJ93_ZPchr0001g29864 [Zizania palustris]|uniref:Uncharacterized protein n=1 Tax=Zizania palustris TaxID=103762 RepID=A0A8J5VP24_ZIZPA|nr:hypothetical protein GUJ93_ZPchr0001g29864 [Zizania palustris]